MSYINNSKKTSEIPTEEDLHELIDDLPGMQDAQADKIFKNIIETTAPTKKKSQFWKYTAVAVVVIALASGYFLKINTVKRPSEAAPIIVKNKIQIGTDKAILTLENGEEISLEKETNVVVNHATSSGEKLVYDTKTNTTSEIAFNYLTIPRGGQFQLELADGTKVWLNSETKLKYPVAFVDGALRQVELMYGEAYFEVSPSSKHHGSKFNVKSQVQNIEVLGTEFNIKAYKNSSNIYTTLVEGKVALNSKNSRQNLIPSQQAILNIDREKLTVKTVDVYDEISWKNGLFSFKGKPLKEIMVVLSRWYDIEFEFRDHHMENIKFNGVLLKRQSIEDILNIIKETKFINAYEINDKKIIIN
ncbi:FecR family protein [Gelidibacter mesophilus]|uniref:FecR family protein n=1 Tax=Gelidibacter mesophilus TaxID=169050 RepID=UPI00146D817C|nr:FecR family protein [Gelidibacter mesophilus]